MNKEIKLVSPLTIVLAVLTLIGVAAWIFQLGNGLAATGMSNVNSWGTYICLFMFFVGLSAGGLIVASSASVFNIAPFKQVAKPAIILSTVCICAAAAFVLVDLGGIQRIYRLIIGMNLSSPLAWDVIVITCYLVINVVYLWMYTRPEPDMGKIKIVSCIALPVAILVHTVTAWIFGLQIGREWYSAIMGPLFVASALDSGLALLLIVLTALKKLDIFDTPADLMTTLAGLLAVFIAVDFYLVGCEIVTMAYPGGSWGDYLALLATGPTAPFFWFEVVCGLVLPFILLAPRKNREKTGLAMVACALVVLGVLCKRIWLLFTAFIVPNVQGGPGVTVGNPNLIADGGTAYALMGSYAPTAIELLVALGVIALAALAFVVIARSVFRNAD